MEGSNYWDNPYRVIYAEIPLVAGTTEYKLSNILDEITQREVYGIRIRLPNANAYTKKGAPLVTDAIFYASHLILVDSEEKNKIEQPLSSIAERTGGDNNFLRLNKRMQIDFTSGRSFIKYSGTSGALATAVAAGQAFEIEIMFSDPTCKI